MLTAPDTAVPAGHRIETREDRVYTLFLGLMLKEPSLEVSHACPYDRVVILEPLDPADRVTRENAKQVLLDFAAGAELMDPVHSAVGIISTVSGTTMGVRLWAEADPVSGRLSVRILD